MTDFEAVFFDIGGVIVDLSSIRQGYVDFLWEFCRDRGLDPDTTIEEWRSVLGEHFTSGDGTEYRTAKTGYEKAFRAIVDGDLDREAWWPGFKQATGDALAAEPDVIETIERLDRAGLYLGIISDIDTWEAHRLLERFGIDDAFDGVTTSEAVGYKKPDQRMFRDALDRAGVDPDRSLMIGDRYENDMQGGSEAGLVTVAYGGTAAERVAEAERDGYRVRGDEAVDYVIESHPELLEIVDVE